MPEEEAFTIFVKVMYDYGVRDLFKPGFDALHLKFFQVSMYSFKYEIVHLTIFT